MSEVGQSANGREKPLRTSTISNSYHVLLCILLDNGVGSIEAGERPTEYTPLPTFKALVLRVVPFRSGSRKPFPNDGAIPTLERLGAPHKSNTLGG